MAIKSANTKGNPYHNESDGRFTSADGSSAKGNEANEKRSISLKPGFDLASAKSALQQAKTASAQPAQPAQQGLSFGAPNPAAYRDAATIDEAIQIGRSILPGCLVNYSKKVAVNKANEMNKALSELTARYPRFLANGFLSAYGDGLSLDSDELMKHVKKAAHNVILNDEFLRPLFDEFMSKMFTGSGNEDTRRELAMYDFIGVSFGYPNADSYTMQTIDGNRFSGFTLAYNAPTYQLKNPIAGGKSISNVIKFYAGGGLELYNPTPVTSYGPGGFHFDIGGHDIVYSVATHELGHAIFTAAYKKCSDQDRAELNKILQEGMGKYRNQLSGYGRTNNYEQEAEAVSDVMCRGKGATPQNKRIVAWLDKVHANQGKGGAQ